MEDLMNKKEELKNKKILLEKNLNELNSELNDINNKIYKICFQTCGHKFYKIKSYQIYGENDYVCECCGYMK